MTKTALITGITGQDGSYLAELLLEKNYTVVGLQRRSSTNTNSRIQHILNLNNPNLIIEEFDLTDPSGAYHIVKKYQPDELYNLAAQSHVGTSFKQPTTTFEIDTIGVINLLESIRHFSPNTRFYQASTSEMFGSNFSTRTNPDGSITKYQDENTPFLPNSPYAIAKLASHRLVQIYRSSYNLFSCSGILFNHESSRRGENFVTRKITKYIGQLSNNLLQNNQKLHLGNIQARRDWGHAKDYVEAMYLMLQQDSPEDYVISTGQTHSVEEFLSIAFNMINLNYQDYIVIDPEFYRPCEVDYLLGDSSKANQQLGWNNKVSFNQLVNDMVLYDIEYYKHEKKL